MLGRYRLFGEIALFTVGRPTDSRSRRPLIPKKHI